MRQEILGVHKGPKTIWDDLPSLYAEFGGEKNFNRLLDELSLLSDWEKEMADILRDRREGKFQREIGALKGYSKQNIEQKESRALQVLADLDNGGLVTLGRHGRSSPRTILANPKGIMREIVGEDGDYEARFEHLLSQLEEISAPWNPEWGKKRVEILRAVMAGHVFREVGESLKVHLNTVRLQVHEALDALQSIARGEKVVPRRVGRPLKNELASRYGDSQLFWNYVEILSWSGQTWHERNQAAEGAAILRARAEGRTLMEIGEILQTHFSNVDVVQKWALENLDRIHRGEEVQFRRKKRPREE